jgi:hypothetical protein
MMGVSLLVDFNIYSWMKKSKKHKEVTTDYDAIKAKHLEKLATDMLKKDEKMNQLKGKVIDPGFLNLF